MKYKIKIYLLIMSISISCTESKDMLLEKFKIELEKQGIKIEKIDDEGLIHINHNDVDLQISLDNLRKDFKRDKDETRIIEFVETIKTQFIKIPDWSQIRDKIYIGLFPNDLDFSDILNEKVSDKFRKIFTLHFNNQIIWITNQQLSDWKISKEQLREQANNNLSKLLTESKIEIEDIDGHKLGLINCEETSLKSSLVFSNNLREKIDKEFGWPINAVIPVRDFCYIFSKEDFEYFSNRIGKIVVEEFTQSSYPITTELLEISDSEIKVIGEYLVE